MFLLLNLFLLLLLNHYFLNQIGLKHFIIYFPCNNHLLLATRKGQTSNYHKKKEVMKWDCVLNVGSDAQKPDSLPNYTSVYIYIYISNTIDIQSEGLRMCSEVTSRSSCHMTCIIKTGIGQNQKKYKYPKAFTMIIILKE